MNAVSGEAVIRAEGNILGGYFESAKIFAGKNIYLSSCLNSDLTAKGEIVTFGSKGGIIGGRSYAEKGFCISNVGNEMEKQTCLLLGITKEMKEKHAKYEEELRDVQEDIKKLELAHDEMCSRYPAVLRNAMKIFIRLEDTIHIKKLEQEEIISRQKALQGRIAECIRKPFDANLIKLKLRNVISLFKYKNELKETVQKQNNRLKMQNKMLQLQAEQLKKDNDNMIAVLGTLVEHRDLESGEHINRVKAYTEIMANELMKQFPEYNLTEHDIKIIVAASPLHYIMNARDSISLRDARADGSSPVGLLHMI
jgi:uncharacterized protein (DUF342 family)